ncbi:MAG: VWA domain-containing protein [Phycisphaerales bacterium]
MFRFEDPALFALLALLPLIWLAPRARRAPHTLFSSTAWAEAAGRSLRQRCLPLLPILRSLALIALIIAAARPQWGAGQVQTRTRGVAIIAALDRSSSMHAPMPTPQGPRTRFDVAQQVFRSFVLGEPDTTDTTLDGRPNDLIGLISFARYAETTCPLVHDHDTLAQLAEALRPAAPDSLEDGTAIGEALALAAARLDRAEQDLKQRQRSPDTPSPSTTDSNNNTDPAQQAPEPDFEIKSKAIILLTDGNETAGQIPALEAADLCAKLGIRVYAIAIGSQQLMQVGPNQFIRTPASNFNPATLQRIAETTDGRFWSADDADALRRIYAEIDALETSEITSIEYTNYDERFTLPAIIALALLAAELLLAHTILRKEPA